MRTRRGMFFACTTACLTLLAWTLPGHGEVSTESLLDELTDLDRLTRLPQPAYVTRQFSSYNRNSKTPADAEGWFANRDMGYYLRTEQHAGRQEYMMMDVAGPGAIVRIWSANNKAMLRIYIDGSNTPAIEGTIPELLGGKYAGIPEPLAGCRARGWNLYFPIAYARHCKVTSELEPIHYHVNYRTYAAGTPVRSFEPADLTRWAHRIEQIAQRLKTPRTAVELPAARKTLEYDVDIAPDARVQLAEVTGPAAVCEFVVIPHVAGPDLEAALRACVLEIRFDDARTVECPLGDFFGTAPGATPYESLPMGITDGPEPQMWSHWRMPFQRVANVQVRNLGTTAVRLSGRVAVVPREFDAATCYFHAGWRIERDIPTRPFSDWTHLDCTGTGRFVGSALNLMNPVQTWWGEGDEKIWVDGEAFPSHFGTGSEDYYGYAWCSPERFVHAFHNQPRCDGPRNYGHTSVNRFHIIDDIPFTRSFRFDMENWHHNAITRTTRAAVSYWYARPGGTAKFAAIDREQVAPVRVPPFELPRVAGVTEAEAFTVVMAGATAGIAGPDERFSGGHYLLWQEAAPGDRIDIIFPAEDGDRQLRARLMLNRRGPQVRLYVNGQPGGDVVDLSHDRNTPTESEIDLGRHTLRAGENILTLEVVGPGKKTGPNVTTFIVGLDYLRIE
ncbi:MAG TPA: DUF2961 domain-containing protein [Phycisphaerae bacterium]|nr:DUF2961 domain-containing protein [Phycisphaerae bacterium]